MSVVVCSFFEFGTVSKWCIRERVNSLPLNKILDLSKLKEFAVDNFEFNENGRKFSNRLKTLWEKEKLLVTSNFSFSHCVFKRLILQTGKNQGLFVKGLTTLNPFPNDKF